LRLPLRACARAHPGLPALLPQMPPKGKKKDPNAPTLVPEDTYVRARKVTDLKVAIKPPKGDLTAEEWCIPPALHSVQEFKQVIHYWKQCAIVQYAERKDLKTPSRIKAIEQLEKKAHPLKELKELFKYMKTVVKQATKRTNQFLKQLEKKEKKEEKRLKLVDQISEVGKQKNEELRTARRFTEKQQLFDKKYMIGSKLGEKGPRKNALILIEASDKQMEWIEQTKDEVTKLLHQVIENDTETYNVATFSVAAQNTWCPQFQNKADPKKGMPDSEKWLKKNVSPKLFSPQPYPPDFMTMLTKFTGEGEKLPWRIYLCCSRAPEGSTKEVLELIKDLREKTPSPAKNEPVLPINVVAFDPTIVGDAGEKAFFDELAGPDGSFLIDTSAEDQVALDKMLKAVAVKKKQLDKLNKKLDKMEDLSKRVAEDRSLLQMQIALQQMLEEDKNIIDWAIKNDTPMAAPEI